jgi:hypothetical protein
MSDTTSAPHPEPQDTIPPDNHPLDSQPDPQADHPVSDPSGPGEALRRDNETMFGSHAGLEDRIAAGEDAIKQVLGFLRWMFPAHPVPTFERDPDSGLMKPGPVAPEIAGAVTPDPTPEKDEPKPV